MIEFIMINPKSLINSDYISDKLEEILRKYDYKLIDNVVDESFYVSSKIEMPITRNKHGKSKSNSNVEAVTNIELKTYEKIQQLEVNIGFEDKEEGFQAIEKLKINLKDELLKDWNECIWLSDTQSIQLSEKLYLKIHKLENLFREIVNRIMISNFGADWWGNLTSYKIRSKYKERGKYFANQVPSFKGINDKLLAVEVDDLVQIMKYKVKRMSNENINEFIDIYESLSVKGNIDEVIKKYKGLEKLVNSKLVTEVDLAQSLFYKYFDQDFEKQWGNLRTGRNHVAHNKLIDTIGAEKISDDIEGIERYLLDLKTRLEAEPSAEQIQYEKENYFDYEESLISIMESEAGITIYNEDSIIVMFEELVNPFIDNLKDEFYFRQDIEMNIEEINGYDQSLEILNIERKWGNKRLTVIANMEIDEEQISNLILTMYINETEINKSIIEFQNGQAYYDGDKGYYMPQAYEKLDENAFIEFTEKLTKIVESEFVDYVSLLESEEDESYRNGGHSVIAEFDCEECGNQTVSLNDDIFIYGKCATCGHEHSNVESCLRCECIFNANIDGGLGLCDRCYEEHMAE